MAKVPPFAAEGDQYPWTPCQPCMQNLKINPWTDCDFRGSNWTPEVIGNPNTRTKCSMCGTPRNKMCCTMEPHLLREAANVYALARAIPEMAPNGWTFQSIKHEFLAKNSPYRMLPRNRTHIRFNLATKDWDYPEGTPDSFKQFWYEWYYLMEQISIPDDRDRKKYLADGGV